MNDAMLVRFPRLLRTRLLLAFVAVGVVPLLLLATFVTLFSINFVTRVYNERALQQIAPISSDLEELLLRYRHLAYVLSQDDTIIDVLAESQQPDRDTSLAVYRLLYRSLAGHLEGASLHIASSTRTPSLSTHQFPSVYRPVNGRDGIYRMADASPLRTVLYPHAYPTDKGEVVNFSLAKSVLDEDGRGVGYVIVDLFKSYVAETIRNRNNKFFSDIVVADNLGYQAVDIFQPENDGDFSAFGYLSRIDRSQRGARVIDDLVVGWVPILDGSLTVVGSLPTDTSLAGVGRLVAVTAWIVLTAAAIAAVVAVLMARNISSPVHRLSAAMQRVEQGDLSVTTSTERYDEIGLLFRGFNRMVHEIGELLDKTVQEQEALRVAEIKSLQAQINPHFLYNTLGTIKSIAKLHSIPEIVTITTELSRLLRKSMDGSASTISVSESIALVRSFVNIHQLRHPGRYDVRIHVDQSALPETIPALVLQPLVENALFHGLEQKVGGGSLEISVERDNDELHFTVSDDGVGFDPERLADGKPHVGLANVDRRLRLLFGETYGISISSAPNRGCTVSLRVPLQTELELRT